MSSLLTPGAVFAGRYEIVRMLSHGGMGAVYEVIHRDTARRRALKVMLPTLLGDDSMRARFLLEARVTAEVASENLVETFDAGIDAATDQPFLVMELLKGSDLESWVQRGPVPWQEVVTLLSQVARGLDRTHAAGIVHRDLKPENLFVTTREDGAPLVKILDFGIAKVVNESAQKSTRSLGTPLYMAPEMLGRRTTTLSGAVDRYALGHIAYTLLTGEAYFETESRELESVLALLPLVAAGVEELPSARARRLCVTLGPGFDAWFLRATSVAASARFATAKEQIETLSEVLEREPPVVGHKARVAVARTASPEAVTLEAASASALLGEPDRGATTGDVDRPRGEEIGAASAPTLVAGPGGAPHTKDFTVAVDSPPRLRPSRRPLVLGGVGVALVSLIGVTAWLRSSGPSPPEATASSTRETASSSASGGAVSPAVSLPRATSTTVVSPVTSQAPAPDGPAGATVAMSSPLAPSASSAKARASAMVPRKTGPSPGPSECDLDPSRCR